MRIGLRHYGSETVDWLNAGFSVGDCMRTPPVCDWCEREDGRDAMSEPCLALAWTAQPKLSSAFDLPLPEVCPMGGKVPESLVLSPNFPDGLLSCFLDGRGVMPNSAWRRWN